jgi:hypothetical protein
MTFRVLCRGLALVSMLSLGGLASCSTTGSGGTGGPMLGGGCKLAPDCGGCQQCFDRCFCNNAKSGGDQAASQQCLAECRTTGGSGGAGPGGSSGASGAGVGGSGGSTGGSSGAGFGGSGGTGFGGSGGTGPGACDPGVSLGQTCQNITTNDPTCDACMRASCCAAVDACFGDTNCAGLQVCVTNFCPNIIDQMQFSQCVQSNCSACVASQQTVDLFNGIPNCLDANCLTQCP